MWSRKVNIFLLCAFFEIIHAKTYYFNVNKTSNQVLIHNRVNMSNPYSYPSGIYLSELINNSSRRNAIIKHHHPLLDPEWDYNWENVTRKPLPPYIERLYNLVSEEKKGSVRVLFNSLPINSTVIRFNFTNLPSDINLTELELHFYHNVTKDLFQKSLILRLYQINETHFNKTAVNPDIHKLLNVIYILQAESSWQVFKLNHLFFKWARENKDVKFLITISRPNEENFRLFKDKNEDITRTFLVLKSPENGNQEEMDDEISDNNPCRKYDLHVDFEKLNWDKFIIAPRKYNAFNCLGKCQRNSHIPNHTKISTAFLQFNRKSFCCVPVSYKPLPIMFYDKYENIAIKIYREMIVSACGCR